MVARPERFLNRRETAKYANLTVDEMVELIRTNRFPKSDFIVFNTEPRWRRSTVAVWKELRRLKSISTEECLT